MPGFTPRIDKLKEIGVLARVLSKIGSGVGVAVGSGVFFSGGAADGGGAPEDRRGRGGAHDRKHGAWVSVTRTS